MEIELHSYDDEVDIVTSTGVRIHVRPVEVKKQVGVAGTTDQIEVFAVLPVKVGRPALTGADENWNKPGKPDTRKAAVRILFGADHSDDVPYVKGYWPESAKDDDDDADADGLVLDDKDDPALLTLEGSVPPFGAPNHDWRMSQMTKTRPLPMSARDGVRAAAAVAEAGGVLPAKNCERGWADLTIRLLDQVESLKAVLREAQQAMAFTTLAGVAVLALADKGIVTRKVQAAELRARTALAPKEQGA